MFIKKDKKIPRWLYALIGILGAAILKLLVDGT